MAPDPDEVHVHHRIAAEIVGEEVGADVAVERQQRQHRRQHRERGDDQHVRAQRGPGEDRHFHQRHARRAHLDDGREQVHAGQQRSDAGDLQRPDVVVDADVRTVLDAGKRRIREPARARELADEQRDHDQHRAGHRHPEAEVVEERECDVARADLQRHDVVHQARDQRHGHEEDHDHAVRGEDLVVVMGVEIALRAAERHGLLQSHHDGVGEAPQQHDEPEHHVHDADPLVVDAGEPLAPQIAPQPIVGQRGEQRDAAKRHGDEGADAEWARAAAGRRGTVGRRSALREMESSLSIDEVPLLNSIGAPVAPSGSPCISCMHVVPGCTAHADDGGIERASSTDARSGEPARSR